MELKTTLTLKKSKTIFINQMGNENDATYKLTDSTLTFGNRKYIIVRLDKEKLIYKVKDYLFDKHYEYKKLNHYGLAVHSGLVIQTNITSGKYLISYILDYTIDGLKKIIKQYNSIKPNFETLWTGKVILDEVPLNLKNDLPTNNKHH